MGCWGEGDEELATIRARSGICHAQYALAGVDEGRVELVLKLGSVNGAAAAAGTSWVATLNHEVGDDA